MRNRERQTGEQLIARALESSEIHPIEAGRFTLSTQRLSRGFSQLQRTLEGDQRGRSAGRIGAARVLLNERYSRKQKAGSSQTPRCRGKTSLDADLLAANPV